MGILHTRAGDRYRTKHPNTHPINSSTSPAIRASAARGRKKRDKSNDPKDTMMRQTSGRVAALTVSVFCVLGLISIPHQALAQGSSSESRSSTIADSTGANPVTINNAYTNTQGDNARANAGASGSAFNGVAINNADASASSFPPYYRGYGSGWYGR